MIRIRNFFTALVTLITLAPLAHAEPLTNGPVSTTVNSVNYSVYYTNTIYNQILQNSYGSPDPAVKYNTNSPNTLTGLGTNLYFMQPWWNPASSSAAAAAAMNWYNASNWPKNDGVHFPNFLQSPPLFATPFFVWSTGNVGSSVNYEAVTTDGTPVSSTIFINETANYALAGFSQ